MLADTGQEARDAVEEMHHDLAHAKERLNRLVLVRAAALLKPPRVILSNERWLLVECETSCILSADIPIMGTERGVSVRRLVGSSVITRGCHTWAWPVSTLPPHCAALGTGPERKPKVVLPHASHLTTPLLLHGQSRSRADWAERSRHAVILSVRGNRPENGD